MTALGAPTENPLTCSAQPHPSREFEFGNIGPNRSSGRCIVAPGGPAVSAPHRVDQGGDKLPALSPWIKIGIATIWSA
jgi:hypothetical protein